MPRWVAAVLVVLAVGMALASLSAASSSSPNRDLPSWSPSGRRIAYVVRFGPQSRQYDRVMLVSPSGSAPQVLAQFGRSVYVSELMFAGSARLVVALGAQGALCSIDTRTRRVIPLGPPVGGVNNGTCNEREGPLSLGANDTFTVSADGRRVAYVSDSPYESQNSVQAFGGDFAIGLVSSSGGPWRTLPEPINASDEWPSFSPDGSQLVFARSLLAYRTASAPSLTLQSVKGGQARPLHIQGAHPVWSPNGHWIAYQQLAYGPAALLPATLEIVNPVGGSSRAIWTPPTHQGLAFSWSPDSTRLAFLTESGQMGIATLSRKVTFFNLNNLTPNRGESINGLPSNPPVWSPDGKTLLFSVIVNRRNNETRIYAIGSDGQGLHPVD